MAPNDKDGEDSKQDHADGSSLVAEDLPDQLALDLQAKLRDLNVTEDAVPVLVQEILQLVKVDHHHHPEVHSFPVHELEVMDRLNPGFAKTYAEQWELDAEENRRMNAEALTAEISGTWMGVNFGFILALLLAGGAIWLGYLGHTAVSLALVGTSAIGMVPKFIDAWKQLRQK